MVEQLTEDRMWHVSKGIQFHRNQEHGLHVTANRFINPGEILVLEKAHTSSTLVNVLNTHCYHCALILPEAAVLCSGCSYARYCCSKCRSDALAKYHTYECKMLVAIRAIADTHNFETLPFVTKILLSITNQGKSLQEVKDKWNWLDGNADIREVGSDWEWREDDIINTIYNMYRQLPEKNLITKRFELYNRVIDILQTATNFFDYESDFSDSNLTKMKNFTRLLLLHIETGLRYNTFNIRDRESNSVASGFYPTCNSFNHSCANNATFSFRKGNQIAIKALRSIYPGDQICISYGARFAIHPKSVRVTILPFGCRCIACANNWPTIDKMRSIMPANDIQTTEGERDTCKHLVANLLILRFYLANLKASKKRIFISCVNAIKKFETFPDENIICVKEFTLLLQIFDKVLSSVETA